MNGKIFVARRARARVAILVLGAIAVSVFALLLPGLIDSADLGVELRLSWRILLYVCGGLGILVGLFRLPALLNAPAEIRVGPEGIWSRSWSDQTVPWDQVRRVAEENMGLQRVVAVHVENVDQFDVKAAAKVTARLNKASGDYGDMQLLTMQTDRSHDDLVRAIANYYRVQDFA